MNRLALAAGLVVAMTTAGVLWAQGGLSEQSLGLTLRITARFSLAFFLLAFAASAVHRLRPSQLSKWLLKNRRGLGLAFAASHAIHLGLIGARIHHFGDAFWATRTVASMLPGALAYLLILLMALTSNNTSRKRLGRRWLWLHKTGMYVVAAIFAGAYAKGLSTDPLASVLLGSLLVVVALRAWARLDIRRARRLRSAA